MKFVKTTVNTKHDKKAIFEHRGQHYLYSYVNHEDLHARLGLTVHETMVFPCDENGDVEVFSEVESASGYVPSAEMMERVRQNFDSMIDTTSE